MNKIILLEEINKISKMMGVSLKLSINEDFTISKESEYGNIKLINEKKDDEFGYIDFSGYKI